MVDYQMCEVAFWIAEATLAEFLERGLLPPFEEGGEALDGAYAVVRNVEGKIVHEVVIGSERGKRFARVARKKAEMSAREQMSTRDIIAQGRLRPGDTKWPGGIWHPGLSIAVGVSGIYSRQDEVLAKLIAAEIEALVREMVEDETTQFLFVE